MRFHPASARTTPLTFLVPVCERFIDHAPVLSGPIRSGESPASPPRRPCLAARVAGFALTAAPTLIALVFAGGGNAAMLLFRSKQWMSLG
jgi:hypothetical protein